MNTPLPSRSHISLFTIFPIFLAVFFLTPVPLFACEVSQGVLDNEYPLPVGKVITYQMWASSFIATCTDSLASIEMPVKLNGTPTDNVQVSVYTDNGGEIGTLIETASISSADLTASFVSTVFIFSGANTLTDSSTYWIVQSRSGDLNETHYYWFGSDEGSSVISAFFDGSDWLYNQGWENVFTVTISTIIPPSNGFLDMVSLGNSTFSDTASLTAGGLVNWVSESFIVLIIGSGLAVLSALWGWVLALLIIFFLVFFAYRSFRLFVNKR